MILFLTGNILDHTVNLPELSEALDVEREGHRTNAGVIGLTGHVGFDGSNIDNKFAIEMIGFSLGDIKSQVLPALLPARTHMQHRGCGATEVLRIPGTIACVCGIAADFALLTANARRRRKRTCSYLYHWSAWGRSAVIY